MGAPAIGARAPSGLRTELRPMTVDSLDAVMALEVVAYPFPWSRGNFIDALAAGYWAVCLSAPDGELIGYQLAMGGYEEWHLLNLTVAPAHQGRGHARGLLDALVAHAHATAAAWVWLEVRPSNPRALALYERHGFERIGVRRGYYPDAGGRREDALVLRRAVDGAAPDRTDPEGRDGLD
ncbi:MAG: ribosomal protein S18-alanine N-acetyltransferase [Leptothrix sp. (in: b-proteobacteria)]